MWFWQMPNKSHSIVMYLVTFYCDPTRCLQLFRRPPVNNRMENPHETSPTSSSSGGGYSIVNSEFKSRPIPCTYSPLTDLASETPPHQLQGNVATLCIKLKRWQGPPLLAVRPISVLEKQEFSPPSFSCNAYCFLDFFKKYIYGRNDQISMVQNTGF